MNDNTKLLDQLKHKSQRQEATLKETLEQIALVEKTMPDALDLIDQLHRKRDRQNKTLNASRHYIKMLEEIRVTPDTKPRNRA